MLYFNDPAWSTQQLWGAGATMMTIASTARDIVWESGIVWDNKIVWGNHLVGTVAGEKIVWGYVENPGTIAWGDLMPEDKTDGAKIVWSDHMEAEN
jgi:hypothetical protein